MSMTLSKEMLKMREKKAMMEMIFSNCENQRKLKWGSSQYVSISVLLFVFLVVGTSS
jgi:hypothetical protein